MASVTAFNDMMGQFLVELHKTFPEEKSIKKMLTSFDLIKSTSPRLLVDGFKIQNDGGGDINQDALMKMMGSMSGMLGGLPKK